jgi:molybdopterin molybdotransferase
MPVKQQSIVLSFEEARRVVEEHASFLEPRGRELLGLLEACGRVLAEPIHADRDFPPFPRATRDGYAVRAVDVANTPTILDIMGEIRAGADMAKLPRLAGGQAIAIMTGASAPEGADAIVMLEHASCQGNRVRIERPVSAGENIVPAGAEAKAGAQMLWPGTPLDCCAIAVAASVGRSRVVVHGKPRVAVLSTGDEVVDIDFPPRPNQIRNSNSYSLAAQIKAAGGEPVLLPIAPDERRRLEQLLQEGLDCDLLLVSGGVSLGKYDLVERVLAELKAEFFFTGAQIQPGKPVVFGRVPPRGGVTAPADSRASGYQYFLGLPGNPISTMVTFELFARPMVESLAGITPRPLIFTHAKLKKAIRTKSGLKRFLPASISGAFERAEVEVVAWQGSGDIAAAAKANCFLVTPPDRERIEGGEWVPVMLR